jgi:hypothetical protein
MRSDSLDLLGSVWFGNIAFAVQAIPVLRPASHVVDEDDLIVGVHGNGFLANHASILAPQGELPDGHPGWTSVVVGTVVSYVAGAPDGVWSVVATGMAFSITDAAESASYTDRLPDRHDQLIRVHLDSITTYRLPTMAFLTSRNRRGVLRRAVPA